MFDMGTAGGAPGAAGDCSGVDVLLTNIQCHFKYTILFSFVIHTIRSKTVAMKLYQNITTRDIYTCVS